MEGPVLKTYFTSFCPISVNLLCFYPRFCLLNAFTNIGNLPVLEILLGWKVLGEWVLMRGVVGFEAGEEVVV